MALPAWSPPDEDKPAPGALLLVQAFVNTLETDRDRDELADPHAAAAWLALAGITAQGDKLARRDLELVRGLREGLRALLVHNAGGPSPTESDLAPLQQVAEAGTPHFVIASDGRMSLSPRPSGELRDGLTALLVAVRDAQLDGTWARLKACANPECRWAFYDSSRNRRGAWCDMAVCGNRLNNRAFRARERR